MCKVQYIHAQCVHKPHVCMRGHSLAVSSGCGASERINEHLGTRLIVGHVDFMYFMFTPARDLLLETPNP
jgi:hypothetical protein